MGINGKVGYVCVYKWEKRTNHVISLTGEYECKMDERGRVKLPQKLIEMLGNKRSYDFIVNRGFEKNLILYPKEVWEQKTKEINQLNIYDKRQREVIRYFYRGATEVTNDSADRILVPRHLSQYAGIEKEVVLFAYLNFVEIWSKDHYDAMIQREPEDFSSLVDGVFGQSASQQTTDEGE